MSFRLFSLGLKVHCFVVRWNCKRKRALRVCLCFVGLVIAKLLAANDDNDDNDDEDDDDEGEGCGGLGV